ncbi:hypothetical protein [Cylindrospermopsis sp. CR12]|uniref:hypothetical protein n=1 Tax=Cylindrospermopsis sp. CR12 TaxID=1747196 RepID=UPI00128F5CBA|nr:hypothetical protein [Cylindrospermopsis sp. CR12]
MVIGDGISDGYALSSSQGKTFNLLLGIDDGILGRLRSTPYGRSHYTPDGRSRGTTYYLKYHEKGELG